MKTRLRTRTLGAVTLGWAAIVAAVLVWQIYTYSGIMKILAEWQFRSFDRFFPITTTAILLLLLTLPLLIIISLRLRRIAKREVYADVKRASVRAGYFARFLNIAFGASAVCAIVLAAIGFSQGSVVEKEQLVEIDQAGAQVAEGPAELRGTVLLDRIGFYREGFVITKRELWLAPIVRNTDTRELGFFVQVSRRDAGVPRSGTFTGVLERRAVPGGLAQLYRNAGYTLTEKPHILFADANAARWPFFSAAADFVILALLLGVVMIFHRRHRRKLADYGSRQAEAT